MANKSYQDLSTQPSGSITKIRAEQIKSEDFASGSLAIDLEALRGQIKDIIGAADYKEEITGEYAKVQIVDLAAHIDASGASSLAIKQAANVVGAFSVNTDMFTIASANGNTMVNGTFNAKGAADLDSTLNVDGASDLRGAVYAYSTFRADGAVDINAAMDVSGSSDLHGAVKAYGTLEVDGESTLASAIVEDLTNTRVTFAGTGGALVDDAKMTFASGVLTVSGSTFSKDVTIVGNLTVQGATTTVDTQNLIVADAKIVISSGGIVDGAGIYLASDSAGENIAWNVAGDKWIVSDKLAAGTLQAEDLSNSIVWADGDGNLIEITTANLGAAVRAELAGTSNQVSISAADASTGISTLSLPQDIHSGASPTFVAMTGSSLTASRLMASNASKGTVSADLYSWVAQTANQVLVADDADGSITLSLPQDIHTGASPAFAAMNFGSYGAIIGVGAGFADLKIAAVTGSLKFDDSFRAASTFGQPLKLAGAGEWTAIENAYGMELSLLAMLAAAAPSTNSRKVAVSEISSVSYDFVIAASANWPAAISMTDGKSDVYVNGQLQVEGAGKDYAFVAAGTDSAKITFTYQLQVGDVVKVVRYSAAVL